MIADQMMQASSNRSSFASGFTSPRGLAWSNDDRLWIADVHHIGEVRWTPPPQAIAAQDDPLLVATERRLTHARLASRRPERARWRPQRS
jgi:hypothetical protein